MKIKSLYTLVSASVLMLIVGCDSLSESANRLEKNYLDETAQQPEEEKPVLIAEPRPQSGTYAENFEGKEAVAPLEIESQAGSDYYVKVVNAANNVDTLAIYIRGGETIEVDVPLGNYEIRYASGNTWYGIDDRFGSETSFNKANEIFSFVQNNYQISGYTITLYQLVDGNLQTVSIDESEF